MNKHKSRSGQQFQRYRLKQWYHLLKLLMKNTSNMSKYHDLSGQQIKQYRLKYRIDNGHFGVVYLAEHIDDGTLAAIKILYTPITDKGVSTFIDEAQFKLFRHPNIVPIKDCGVSDGRFYLIMHYMPHGTLRQRHPQGTILSWETVALYAQQIAEALQYIHDFRTVHRDVKPENILIDHDGSLRLGDLGIAITSYTVDQEIQKPKGTPYYIAPEQIIGAARRASDQYSLGIIMYEWLTGSPPFTGLNKDEVYYKHAYATPEPLRRKNKTVSEHINALIMRMLHKNPEERFANMQDFLAELARIKNPTNLHNAAAFTQHTDVVQSLAWSSDGKYIASAGRDGIVRVWEAATRTVCATYDEHTQEIWSVMWSPDGKYLASAGTNTMLQVTTLKVWDVATQKELAAHSEHQGTIRAITWSPDSTCIASAGDDKVVQIWDFQKAYFFPPYGEHNEGMLCLAWSPKSNSIASGGNDGTVRVWDAHTKAYCSLFRGHSDKITSVAWSPDATLIASASDDGTIQIWQATTGKRLSRYTDHTDTVSVVAWSPDGQYLASGSWDKTVRIWDVASSTCIHVYKGHTGWINAVAWSPTNQYIASASRDTTAHVLEFENIFNAQTLPNL